ncbi:hypothetical protein [uncultured Roseovarius sp.]|uniref:hypothetical protein n=1 Tax=uncultured Roseovarius sp. TaxID=293344 RepID=UPI0025DBDC13|nr:hypothetical protein [uncultured Roseovarius sp.]
MSQQASQDSLGEAGTNPDNERTMTMTKSINPPARRILGLALAATLGAAALPATAMDAGNPPNANKVISTMSGNVSTGPLEHPVSTQDGTRR